MKIQITERQAQQFNLMLAQLKKISKGYQTTAQLRRSSPEAFGVDYEESLEMSYENIQNEAAFGCKGISPIKLTTKTPAL